jgi:tRNA threonylcarbamoyladenosine biosynthesis protein TsaB
VRVLGIETATIVCGAAVIVDGAVVSEQQVQEKNVHAENIMRLIDAALKQSRLQLIDLDAIAVSIGPGSFTGLRIGVSVAKGLAFALSKPLVAVSTLQALAQRAVDAGTVATPFVLSALDARRDEVYCGLFAVKGKMIEPVWEVRDVTLEKLFDELGDRGVTVTGDAIAKLKSHGHQSNARFVAEGFSSCSAAIVGAIGERMAMRGECANARTIEPKYIKEFYMKSPIIEKAF